MNATVNEVTEEAIAACRRNGATYFVYLNCIEQHGKLVVWPVYTHYDPATLKAKGEPIQQVLYRFSKMRDGVLMEADTAQGFSKLLRDRRRHEWGPSRVGHGEAQCVHCLCTNREAAVISPDYCVE